MKNFQVDEQTLHDLEIFGEKNKNSIVSMFDRTVSKGGQLALFRMFEQPATDLTFLENRKNVIEYLAKYPDFIDIDRNKFTFIEIYMELGGPRKQLSVRKLYWQELKYRLKPNNDWNVRRRGMKMLGQLLYDLERWSREFITDYAPPGMRYYRKKMDELLNQSELNQVLAVTKPTLMAFGRIDHIFRFQEKGKVRELLDIIYELEALKSVAETSKILNFVFPEYVNAPSCLMVKGGYHPFLPEAVRNDFMLSKEQRVCFLTGPNMAGKSTYMKALGIAVYLAHIGFPVPAEKMTTSVFRGLFSTINLSDDINLGYSHYYSEVQRIKFVAERIAELKEVVVIFDELFRGTNVKDAYEASLAVISEFAALPYCMFVISTHILEVAEKLQNIKEIDFRCFEIQNHDGEFQYTYLLKPGVSTERLGMHILNRERVVETIRQARS